MRCQVWTGRVAAGGLDLVSALGDVAAEFDGSTGGIAIVESHSSGEGRRRSVSPERNRPYGRWLGGSDTTLGPVTSGRSFRLG